MTSFVRYYDNKQKLINVSMDKMEKLIESEKNKNDIAEYVFQRFYSRFLKVFGYKSEEEKQYTKNDKTEIKKVFTEEYKNGFAIMACCALVIENFAAFLDGSDKTEKGKGKDKFNQVFELAEKYGNELKQFKGNDFYGRIRCGILHQGETYGKFTICRDGKKLKDGERINATIFLEELEKLLLTYRNELKNQSWDSALWDSCRIKLRHIIKNS